MNEEEMADAAHRAAETKRLILATDPHNFRGAAEVITERLHAAVARSPITGAKPLHYAGSSGPFTMSGGPSHPQNIPRDVAGLAVEAPQGETIGSLERAMRGAAAWPVVGVKESPIIIRTVADLLDSRIRQAEAEVARLRKLKEETPTVVLGCQLDFIHKLKGLI
jgi:hypothetical protein